MSHFLSDKLFDDLALSAKTSKILSGLIINYHQLQIAHKIFPIAIMTPQNFLNQQGLYVSSLTHMVIHNNSSSDTIFSLELLGFNFTHHKHERPVVHVEAQLNSKAISLDNKQELGELLIAQLAGSSSETDLTNWSIWSGDLGYLYFQPTPKGLSTWLKMLFDRAARADQDAKFSPATASDHLFDYIRLRCNQVLKLAKPQLNPWVQKELRCTQAAELELIYGIIQVYDSLYMGANYKIVAASKSLGEKFLMFDRTCRLLDLDPHSSAFHERAGLIAIVRSAMGDLLTNQIPDKITNSID